MQRMPFKHDKTDYLIRAIEDAVSIRDFNYRYPDVEEILLYDNLRCEGKPFASLVETELGTRLNYLRLEYTVYSSEVALYIEAILKFYTYYNLRT